MAIGRPPRVVVVRAALCVRGGVGLLAASLLCVPLVVVVALVCVRVASVKIALATATSGCRALVPRGASIIEYPLVLCLVSHLLLASFDHLQ